MLWLQLGSLNVWSHNSSFVLTNRNFMWSNFFFLLVIVHRIKENNTSKPDQAWPLVTNNISHFFSWGTRQIWGIWKLRPAYSPETPNLVQNQWCFSRVTLKFEGWPWKTIGHLSFAVSSFVQHFIAIGEFKLELLSGNAQFGSNLDDF